MSKTGWKVSLVLGALAFGTVLFQVNRSSKEGDRTHLLVWENLKELAIVVRGPAAAETTVTSTGDGMANVTFSPISSGDKIEIFNAAGRPIAQVNWAASFTVSVNEDSIREATTEKGIDLHALLRGVGTVENPNGGMMVAASLPAAVAAYDGSEIAKGTQVYFGLARLATEGAMAPVAAWGGSTGGEGGATNKFNDRLIEKGVRDVRPRPVKAPPKHAHSKGPHGDGVTPKDPKAVVGQWTDKSTGFLSAPTCKVKASDTLRTTSEFGRRRSFTTENGARATSNHQGLDIGTTGKVGSPVMAAAYGCFTNPDRRRGMPPGVSFNSRAGYGFSLVLEHPNGLSTQYSHMNGFMPEIREFIRTAKPGQQICFKRGQQIGFIGKTGNCTGPHLHFGVRENGKHVDPRKHLRPLASADFAKDCQVLIAENEPLHALDEQAVAQAMALASAAGGKGTAVAR